MSENKNTYRLLVINPGSTSTKVSIFDDEKELFVVSEIIASAASEVNHIRRILFPIIAHGMTSFRSAMKLL